MNIEELRDYCTALPSVTEDVKWGNDLCFCIGDKMFCVAPLQPPLTISLKVKDEQFDELSSLPGVIPAPYVARYKWIQVSDLNVFTKKEWENYIRQSYELVRAKLPKKTSAKLK